jgi:hypothetical protein
MNQWRLELDTEIAPKQPKAKPMSVEKALDELVGSLCDPIIVWPGGWEDTLPAWIKDAIRIERLIENARAAKEGDITATDAEACAYMYTYCLCQVPDQDWISIYQYLTTKVYSHWRTKDSGYEVPADIRVDKLTEQQERDLAHLKRFIYNARARQRQEKRRAVRREEKVEEHARRKQEQPELPFEAPATVQDKP